MNVMLRKSLKALSVVVVFFQIYRLTEQFDFYMKNKNFVLNV